VREEWRPRGGEENRPPIRKHMGFRTPGVKSEKLGKLRPSAVSVKTEPLSCFPPRLSGGKAIPPCLKAL
jgi:hypothetical protein